MEMHTCSNASEQALVIANARPSETDRKVQESVDLCGKCETLLDHNFHCPWWIPPLKSKKDSACPLCRFLATIASSKDPSADLHTMYYYDIEDVTALVAFPTLLISSFDDQTLFRLKEAKSDILGVSLKSSPEKDDDGFPYHDGYMLPISDGSTDGSTGELSILSFRQIYPDSIDFGVLKGWIHHCQTHHSNLCDPWEPEELRRLPGLRVIDCKTRAIIYASENCTYAALSYVWGSPAETQGANDALRERCLQDHLPNTISDAVQVVLGLNLRYLWVDKYCIDQSDEANKRNQISNMDMIYNWACVTIVATAGDDPSYGLQGVGHRRRPEQSVINLKGKIWVSSLQRPEPAIKISKWATRAWTYQEGLFSRRRLFFTEDQIYYECNAVCCIETVDFDFHQLKDSTDALRGGLFNGGFGSNNDGLDKHIERYTKRNLSWPGDIINGLLGVFRAFSRMPTPTRQYWGIPVDHHRSESSPWPSNQAPISAEPEMYPRSLDNAFAMGLCWTLEKPTVRRKGFPSWSWAGWVGPLQECAWGTNYLSVKYDPEVKIWLQKVDSTFDRLDESVINSVTQSDPTTIRYTPILRIEAWTVEVSFYFGPRATHTMPPYADGITNSTTGRYRKYGRYARTTIPEYFVLFEYPVRSDSLYWPMYLSVEVKENNGLHLELCRQKFDCIRLRGEESFGLVVRRNGDTTERIGFIDLEMSLSLHEEDPSWWFGQHRHKDLFDYLPLTRRVTLLA